VTVADWLLDIGWARANEIGNLPRTRPCGSYCWACWHTHSPGGDCRRCRCDHPLTHPHAEEAL